MSSPIEKPDARITTLLQNPLLWRARSSYSASSETFPTGFEALDERLPGRGWPTHGLIEVLAECSGTGELSLLMPLLNHLCEQGGWHTWVAPPYEPYVPALTSRGVNVERMLVVNTTHVLWAMEQALRSNSCHVVFGWTNRARPQGLRRLQLAAEQNKSLGVIFRHLRWQRESSPAVLRLVLMPSRAGLKVMVLKSRGGRGGQVLLQAEAFINNGPENKATLMSSIS